MQRTISPERPLYPPLREARVVIVLAAYQGGRFLGEQLSSIQQQSWRRWRLLLRDDGSSDDTLAVARAAASADPRITIVDRPKERLGAAANFGQLLLEALRLDADYVLLADQDDVWQLDKLQRQLQAMAEAERRQGAGLPILLHTDLEVVDEDLSAIHPSFMHYQGLSHEAGDPLRTLLVQNFVTGCTCLLNRPLLEFATPLPAGLPVHDWWIALCAAAAGHIEFLSCPTVLYRQHARNAVGASGYRNLLSQLRRLAPGALRRHSANFAAGVHQARELLARLEQRNQPAAASLELLRAYDQLFAQQRPLRRLLGLHQLGIHRRGTLRQLGFAAQVVKNSRP